MTIYNQNEIDGDDTAIKGGTDGSIIGNDGDRLLVNAGSRDISGSQDVIDHEHYMIHIGRSFNYSTYASGITNGTVTNFIIITPASPPWIHFRHLIWLRDNYLVEIYEDATYTGGSTATSYNKSRGSANTTGLVIKTTPTITSTGTRIWSEKSGGAVGAASSISGADGLEWILKVSTTYLLRLTSQSASNAYSMGLNWYEAGL